MVFETLRKLGSMTPGKLMRPTSLPIAIDFGVSGMKILQIEAGDIPKLVAASFVPTPPELMNDHVARFDFQLQSLPRAIKQGGFKGHRAVCAIPAGQTFCKPMQFQKVDGLSLEQLVQGAVSSHIGCEPSALVYRHVEVPTPGVQSGRQEVICTAVPRVLIDRLLAGMRSAKLEVVGIHSEFAAVLRAFDYITHRTDDVSLATLYLDLGASATKVAIAHGTKPVFARVIELGGRQLDEAVIRQTKCTLTEARSKRYAGEHLEVAPPRSAGPRAVDEGLRAMATAMRGSDNATAAAAMKDAAMEERRAGAALPGLTSDVRLGEASSAMPEGVDLKEELEILTDEVRMCLRYHDSLFPGRKLDRGVFMGGEALHRGLCQHLAKSLKIPVQVADPMARLLKDGKEPANGVNLKQSQPGWAVAMGLCMAPTDL